MSDEIASKAARLRLMDEAVPEVAQANLWFSVGDRVVETKRGWHGVVEHVESSKGAVTCRFNGVGQCGVDPRNLRHQAIKEPSR